MVAGSSCVRALVAMFPPFLWSHLIMHLILSRNRAPQVESKVELCDEVCLPHTRLNLGISSLVVYRTTLWPHDIQLI